jgi:ligand-binding SRPBCC domain-containing protein
MYTLHRELTVHAPLETVWEFIRNPANLNQITPTDMSFEIMSDLPDKMYEGLLVEYRVRLPLLGLQPWLSEIKHINPQVSFVDEQKIGPYKLWYHDHKIEAVDGGVKLTDHVTYEVPYGGLGNVVHHLFIRNKLKQIFDYREKCLREIFSQTG